MEINSLPDSLRNGAPVTLSWSGLFFHRCQAGAPGPLAPAYSRPADLGQHHAVPHLGRNSPLPCSSSTRPSGHRRQPPGGANQCPGLESRWGDSRHQHSGSVWGDAPSEGRWVTPSSGAGSQRYRVSGGGQRPDCSGFRRQREKRDYSQGQFF